MAELVLGVSEAFTNAIRHGSSRDGDVILTTVVARPSEIAVTLHYRGDGFQHKLPDRDEIRRLEAGGIGRYIMYSVLDEVTYTFHTGFTSVRMVKRSKPTTQVR